MFSVLLHSPRKKWKRKWLLGFGEILYNIFTKNNNAIIAFNPTQIIKQTIVCKCLVFCFIYTIYFLVFNQLNFLTFAPHCWGKNVESNFWHRWQKCRQQETPVSWATCPLSVRTSLLSWRFLSKITAFLTSPLRPQVTF